MGKLNQEESDTLALLIALMMNQAKWLVRALIVTGLLGLASLVPVLSGPILSILLELALWACVFLAGFILVGNILAYYYVIGCARNNLERFIKQAKKKAGK